MSTTFLNNYSYLLNPPKTEIQPIKEEDPTKSYVDKRKQKAVEVKL